MTFTFVLGERADTEREGFVVHDVSEAALLKL